MAVELQDIIREHLQDFLKEHQVTWEQAKAIMDILNCRTAALGGRIQSCPECEHTVILYNSCRNRHCPKCQTLAKEKWIDARLEDLLPVPYFHVVFTIPEELNAIMYQNKQVLYKLFFTAVAETLAELSADSKYLNAQIGFTSILHSWGQNLMFHPHIHCIVPNAGLTKEGLFKQGSNEFFLPVKVASRKFRGKFLYMLRQEFGNGKLVFHGNAEYLKDKFKFGQLVSSLYNREWIVYTKKTFSGPEAVIEYLGRYTHRIAISNNRILKLENGLVTFKWRDYRDNKEKVMTITAIEFIRRFLMHVLPYRFMKIRHYGLLSNRNRNSKLRSCQKLAGNIVSKARFKNLCAAEIVKLLTGKDITLCPSCHKGKLVTIMTLWPRNLSPPLSA